MFWFVLDIFAALVAVCVWLVIWFVILVLVCIVVCAYRFRFVYLAIGWFVLVWGGFLVWFCVFVCWLMVVVCLFAWGLLFGVSVGAWLRVSVRLLWFDWLMVAIT